MKIKKYRLIRGIFGVSIAAAVMGFYYADK